MFLAALQNECQTAAAIRLDVLRGDALWRAVHDDIGLAEQFIQCSSHVQPPRRLAYQSPHGHSRLTRVFCVAPIFDYPFLNCSVDDAVLARRLLSDASLWRCCPMVAKRRDDVSLTALGQLTAKDLERPCGLVEKLGG